MEREIWVIDSDRQSVIEIQRQINNKGGMRAVCLLSYAAVQKVMASERLPSLILVDYDTQKPQEFQALKLLKSQAAYAGIPYYFMVGSRSEDMDEECYRLGAMVVLLKPLTELSVVRIEHTARQHEITRSYEKMLQRQAQQLEAAKEIEKLNTQLSARNELLQQVFGRYFSDDVVEVILNNPEEAMGAGGKREVSVMITDLRGFTAISDTLPPEIVTGMVNQYLGTMTDTILEFGGTVIEFMGDGILAVFGAPVHTKTSITDALTAGITMQNRMKHVNRYNIEHGYPLVEMGVGIHKGEVFIGNIGSERMMRYNVIGRAVNVCSRIEGYSVGGQVLVSKETLADIEEQVHICREFTVMPKGMHRSITICEVDGIKGSHWCTLAKVEKNPQIPVSGQIHLLVRKVMEKQIKDEPLFCRLLEMSDRYVKVELEEKNAIQLYANLEIAGVEDEVTPLFANVYGKVLECERGQVGIQLTYVTQEYRDLYERIRSKSENGDV